MLNKIKQRFKNISKPKCPNCKSVKFNQIDEKFIKETTITKYYEKYSSEDLPTSSLPMNSYPFTTSDREIEFYKKEVNIFNIIYRCDSCKHTWNKEVHKDILK